MPSEVASQLFGEINTLADQALQEIRATSYLLHPPLLDEAGFTSAARMYIDGFNRRSRIQVQLQVPECPRMPYPVEIALFRVLQESLGNAIRHSGTPTVDVRLEVAIGVATLSVRDYGKGISAERLERIKTGSDAGVGIPGMAARLRESWAEDWTSNPTARERCWQHPYRSRRSTERRSPFLYI